MDGQQGYPYMCAVVKLYISLFIAFKIFLQSRKSNKSFVHLPLDTTTDSGVVQAQHRYFYMKQNIILFYKVTNRRMLSNQYSVFADEACNSLLWMKATTLVKDSRAVKVLSQQGILISARPTQQHSDPQHNGLPSASERCYIILYYFFRKKKTWTIYFIISLVHEGSFYYFFI